jgi:dTDP-4-amino-4,6-dideoxygalactose transaminase
LTGRVYLSAPDVGELEESYLVDALRSGWVAPAGPQIEAFEREVASRVGVEHAVALNTGTAALHLSLVALGVGPGDVVVVPTLTFVATANAVMYTGAEPLFIDCDPATGNIDPALVADALTRMRRSRQVSALLSVDMLGRCADYATLLPLCSEHGVPVVEDAAEALGAMHNGRPAGSFGVAAALSFNGNKIMTTSGGGMLLSDDDALATRGRYLSQQARQPVPHYEHADVGYNYRLSNLLAALGRAQLRRLDGMIERRRTLRDRYVKLFAAVDGVELLGADDPGANCWLTTIVVDPARAGWSSSDLSLYLGRHDIETRPVWKPMHLQPVFAGASSLVTGAAQRLFENGLTLPSGSGLGEEQISRVFDAISGFLEGR